MSHGARLTGINLEVRRFEPLDGKLYKGPMDKLVPAGFSNDLRSIPMLPPLSLGAGRAITIFQSSPGLVAEAERSAHDVPIELLIGRAVSVFDSSLSRIGAMAAGAMKALASSNDPRPDKMSATGDDNQPGAPRQPSTADAGKRPRGIGDILLREKVISPEALARARAHVAKKGGNLGSALVQLGTITPDVLLQHLSQQYNMPAISLRGVQITPEMKNVVPKNLAQRHKMVPIDIDVQGKRITVAFADPMAVMDATADIHFFAKGFQIEPVIAPEGEIDAAIGGFYGEDTIDQLITVLSQADIDILKSQEPIDASVLAQESNEPPIVRLVNLILIDAIRKGASDIHVEPFEDEFVIRYRIDGILHLAMTPPLDVWGKVVSRLKIMSELNIAEKRLPQSGRIKLKIGDRREVNIRVETSPVIDGESVVLRIQDPQALSLDLTQLGFLQEQLAQFESAIARPHGMVLITGPTGSGKTATLYSALNVLNTPDRSILTIEDPVEVKLRGIRQTQVNADIGLKFDTALRSFLRQDPDVIMVGEIRDYQTAEIAIQAAMTGHLVFSTLHTNDAPSTISRLAGMGVDPPTLAATVILIAAQRLVRQICPQCREFLDVPREALTDAGVPEEAAAEARLFQGRGCNNCNHTGYKGRTGIYEVMTITDELSDSILRGDSKDDLRREARRLGMKTLLEAGFFKMLKGETTLAEILRVTKEK